MSTLTDWIWNRAREIKDVCNTLCRPLFDFSEQRIDYGTQKQLSQCCKQLKVLSDLLIIIIREYHRFIPDPVLVKLNTQSETIKMASDYQEVLQWLLNVGLLPEGHCGVANRNPDMSDEFLIVPYPYQTISAYYYEQRTKLSDEWSDDDNRWPSRKSKFLFIDTFIEHECNSKALPDIWGGIYPPRSIQALLRTLLVPDISIHNKHVIFVYLFMDITNCLNEGVYSSIVRNLIKFPAVFKMNPAIIKRTQAFWNLDNGNLRTAVEELISPLSHDKHLPLWQRELLLGALLKQNASSLALRALRCPGNQISPDLEMLTLLANNLMSEALKVQRASGDRKLLEKLFEKILLSSNYEHLLDLSLTEEEGNVLRDCLKNMDTNHLNIHFVYLLQRSKFLDAAQLVESMCHETTMNMEPPKQVLNAYYATMESTTRRLTSIVHSEDVQAKESPLPLSVNLIQARCNAKNDIYQKCVQSITEAAYESSQHYTAPTRLPFIGSPKLGIFEYKQTSHNIHDLSYNLELNEHGKRRQVQKSDDIIRLDGIDAPKQKKRRLNDTIVAKRKSYLDMHINQLTVFKDTKPIYNFSKRSPDGSFHQTPERVHLFGNFLNTPIVQKRTPAKKLSDSRAPGTPHSILKTRSHRGSVSPAPSRISEFGDDNKSVKSITFAALPDSRDTSMNDSFNDEPVESSAEAFYSPGKSPEAKSISFLEGPKARKSIKSRSTTPVDQQVSSLIETSPQLLKEVASPNSEHMGDEAKNETELDETMSSEESQEYGKPFREGNVLGETPSDDDSGDSDSSSPADKSIYNYVRRSVLPANYGEISDSSSEDSPAKRTDAKDSTLDDSESVDDEHFEEEELPEHSDYDDSSENDANGDECEYGHFDLDDSDESENQELPITRPTNDNKVICLDSSSDDEAVQEILPALPSFVNLSHIQHENSPESSFFADFVDIQPTDQEQPQEKISSVFYGGIEQPTAEKKGTDKIESESPAYEEIEPVEQPTPVVEQSNCEHNNFVPLEQASIRGPSDVFNNAAINTNDSGEASVFHHVHDDNSKATEYEESIHQENINEFEMAQFGDDMEEEEEITSIMGKQATDLSIHNSFTDRVERAKSVPSSSTSSSSRPRSRSIRANTEDRENPKNLLRGKLIERIDEIITPGRLTRSRSQLLEAGEHVELPRTPTRRARRRSHLSEEGSESSKKSTAHKSTSDTQSTPKRITRAASKEPLGRSGTEKSDEPSALTRTASQRSLRKRATSVTSEEAGDVPKLRKVSRQPSTLNVVTRKMSESLASLPSVDDDARSIRSTRSTAKKSPSSSGKVTPETSPTADAPSTSNRRLTRKQLQVIEKSRQIQEKIASAGALRATKSDIPNSSTVREESDNDSVKSESGSNASSRPRRRRQLTKRYVKEDDSSSVTSKSSRRSPTPAATPKLSVIPEESTIEGENLPNFFLQIVIKLLSFS